MSRFLNAARHAERKLSAPRDDWKQEPRPFQVITVASNKGGVGKTTVAANLAVYFRALLEDLPVLVVGFDDQLILDQMFAFESGSPDLNVVSAMKTGNLNAAIRLGQYGVHYIPSSEDLLDLKRMIEDPFYLQRVLLRTGWEGLVVIDTKSDLEILTQNAIAASDLALVLVADGPSLRQAERVYDLLKEWDRPLERAQVLLSMVDLRIKYGADKTQDVLSLLISEIRRRGYPLFESFLSRSPLVASLYTNPEEQALPILHGAEGSVVRRQMQHLAEDVLRALEEVAGPLPLPSFDIVRIAEPAAKPEAAVADLEEPMAEVEEGVEHPALDGDANRFRAHESGGQPAQGTPLRSVAPCPASVGSGGVIHVGSLVRIADREALEEALVGTTAHLPEPMQFQHAGATARVVQVLVSADGEHLYGLDGRPGLWRESWLSPLTF